MSSYPVKLVAVSGREQPVVLKVKRDGLWLYTEHGKEIQQLPYQHIVKWLPSKMRSRDPGPDDCLDIQVETASGKKDLRMRCQSEPTVQTVIADIRQTVQAIMTDLDPAKGRQDSPLKASLAATAAANKAPVSPADPAHKFDNYTRHVSENMQGAEPSPARSDHVAIMNDAAHAALKAVAACAAGLSDRASPQKQYLGSIAENANASHQQQQQQNTSPVRRSLSASFRLAQQQQQQQNQQPQHIPNHQQQQLQQQQQDCSSNGVFIYPQRSSSRSPSKPAADASQRAYDRKEMELEVPARVEVGRLGAGAPLRRSTGELAEFSGEAAAQIAFLEDMVARLSYELSTRMGENETGSAFASGLLDAANSAALPPWLKDSRYLNPLLSAYDQRLNDVQSELTAKTNAVRDIKTKVRQLVEENEALHDRLAEQASRLEGQAMLVEGSYMENGADRARLQERLELLEHENDLLVRQQGEMDVEIARLSAQLTERDTQLAAVSDVAAQGSTRIVQLEQALAEAKTASGDTPALRDKIKDLSDRLKEESARTAEAIAAADLSRQQSNVLQAELAAAQASARLVPGLQADLSKARSAAESSAAQTAALRSEADSLRSALHTVETRLAEYQQKDTEVYLRIKEAMELAEEARLERDAARTETESLQVQLAAAQAKLQDAARQLSGGGDGAPSYKELQQRLNAAEGKLQDAVHVEQEQATKLSELRLTVERLNRDKSSLKAELAGLREEVELYTFSSGKPAADMPERIAELERARDDALQKLDSQKRAATRMEREWELEKQQLQGDMQRWVKRVAAAEDAAATAAKASTEAEQAAAAAESELAAFKAARARAESELRQQLVDLRQERDAEVAALVQKLERALATCDKSVVDAEQMLQAKDSLLRRWKQEAQLIASKLEVALQQHQAELAERQAQVVSLTQQLAAAHEQQELLQQELDATRMTCQEAELLLGEAESRAAAANASAVAQQDDIMMELRTLQNKLERSELDKARAERARDGVAAKLGRMMMASSNSPGSQLGRSVDLAAVDGPHPAAPADPAAIFGSPPRSPVNIHFTARGDSAARALEPSASSSDVAGASAAAPAVNSSPRAGLENLKASIRNMRGSQMEGSAAAAVAAVVHSSPRNSIKELRESLKNLRESQTESSAAATAATQSSPGKNIKELRESLKNMREIQMDRGAADSASPGRTSGRSSPASMKFRQLNMRAAAVGAEQEDRDQQQ